MFQFAENNGKLLRCVPIEFAAGNTSFAGRFGNIIIEFIRYTTAPYFNSCFLFSILSLTLGNSLLIIRICGIFFLLYTGVRPEIGCPMNYTSLGV